MSARGERFCRLLSWAEMATENVRHVSPKSCNIFVMLWPDVEKHEGKRLED